MPRLVLSDALGELFLGGLLLVARADGVVLPEEMRELRATAGKLGIAWPSEVTLLEAHEVTAAALAEGFGARAAYRDTSGSSPADIGRVFLESALRVALADHELQTEEVELLREVAAALEHPTDGLAGWEIIRRWG